MYQQPMYPPPQQPYYRPQKDYVGEAFLTLALYIFGFWIVGFIVNIIFLSNAKRDESMGIATQNVGCLQALLWIEITLFVLSTIGCLLFFFVFGGLAMLEGFSY